MANEFRVDVKFNRFQQLAKEAPQAADRAIEAMAREGERYIKQSFGTSPSSPGDTPGVDTGALRSSINVQQRGRMVRAIADGVEYGVMLEFGTSRMGARPFMAPAAMWLNNQTERIFKDFIG
jgi:HK97 gp10 family phage protein